jgi:hypothetical protein
MIKATFLELKTSEQLLLLSDMNKLNVDGHPDLYRDPSSGAIINRNSTEYESYIRSYKIRQSEKAKLENMESNLQNLKNEIAKQ